MHTHTHTHTSLHLGQVSDKVKMEKGTSEYVHKEHEWKERGRPLELPVATRKRLFQQLEKVCFGGRPG